MGQISRSQGMDGNPGRGALTAKTGAVIAKLCDRRTR